MADRVSVIYEMEMGFDYYTASAQAIKRVNRTPDVVEARVDSVVVRGEIIPEAGVHK